MKFPIDEIWIEEDAGSEPLTEEILNRVQGANVFEASEIESRRRDLELEFDPLKRGKLILRLMKHKGAAVKPCPGTREYVCCGLEILHVGQGCPMDCRYCALQAYFNRPVMEVFVNPGELIDGLRSHLESTAGRFHRICTGEFTDSLALDPLTGLASRLVEFFSRTTNASLELKTKTANIEPLLDLDPQGKVIISFSVNSELIASNEERRAVSLAKRLSAASKAEAAGYRVGFHFDPIVPHHDWEKAYCKTIDRIFDAIDPRTVAWISLGVLRFVPELKDAVRTRFGPLPYFHDAFERGLDGKSRLYVERRVGIYRALADRIRRRDPEARIYLCMESPYVWEKSLGLRMDSDEDLERYLDQALIQHHGQ
jgi:DNA repair photolyase